MNTHFGKMVRHSHDIDLRLQCNMETTAITKKAAMDCQLTPLFLKAYSNVV